MICLLGILPGDGLLWFPAGLTGLSPNSVPRALSIWKVKNTTCDKWSDETCLGPTGTEI